MELDGKQLERLLQELADEVAGEWLLIGGGFIALVLATLNFREVR